MYSDAFIKICTAFIALLGSVVTYILIPYVKSKITKEQRENAAFWIGVAVKAAEQIYFEKGQGKIKREYVLEFLSQKGIKISPDQLDVLIEATVNELNKNKIA